MRKFIVIMLSLIMLSGCSFVYDIKENTDKIIAEKISFEEGVSFESIASKVSSAVVGISGIYSSGSSIGSGVCVSENGYILTNSHCIADTKLIKLYLSNNTSTSAKIIYNNPVSDLAIIKSDIPLPYLEIGDSDELKVGQDILAVGTPLSLSLTHSFTKGIVSAMNRTLKVGGESGEGYMQNLIQHDASLNPGNSGGPLINNKGQVVGINTLKITAGEGVGFAIPSKSFTSLVTSYVTNINYELPFLGVYGFDSKIAKYYNATSEDAGFYIIDLADDSPLAKSGVLPTSIITKFNGRVISNTLDLQDELYKLNSSSSVYVEFIYGGDTHKIKTKLR